MTKPHHLLHIYQSRWHMFVTLGVVIAPVVFLFFFAQLNNIALAKLFGDIGISIARLCIAYMLAALLGWVCAVGFYRGRRGAIALPFFDVLQSFPTYAALPLATYFWGPSNFTIIFFLVLAIIWPIFFSIISSLKLIKHDWEEAAQLANLSWWQYLRYFLFPVSIPGIITGSIVGLGDGWEALVATEIIVNIKSGLGSFFQSFAHYTGITAFGIFGLLLIIFAINKLIWLPLLEWSHKQIEE